MSSFVSVVGDGRDVSSWGHPVLGQQGPVSVLDPNPWSYNAQTGVFPTSATKVPYRPTLEILAPENHKRLTHSELRKLQIKEAERISGLTMKEMGELQLAYMQGKADKAGKDIGEYLLDLAGRLGRPGGLGNQATWWPSLSAAQKASWQRRYDSVEKRLMQEAPAPIRQMLKEARALGPDKGIRFDPVACEKYIAYAICGNGTFSVGKSFVEDAEANPKRVYSNIAHELGGHWCYGGPVSMELLNHCLKQIADHQRVIATSGRSLHTIFGYPETEIYAELCELDWRIPTNSTDEPCRDIPAMLKLTKAAFEPSVARALVLALRYRVALDPHVSGAARKLLDESIKDVFGRQFLSQAIGAPSRVDVGLGVLQRALGWSF